MITTSEGGGKWWSEEAVQKGVEIARAQERAELIEELQRGADGSTDAPYREAQRFAADEFTDRAYNEGVSDGIEWAIERIRAREAGSS